jgi:hypothetical protein
MSGKSVCAGFRVRPVLAHEAADRLGIEEAATRDASIKATENDILALNRGLPLVGLARRPLGAPDFSTLVVLTRMTRIADEILSSTPRCRTPSISDRTPAPQSFFCSIVYVTASLRGRARGFLVVVSTRTL